VAICVESTMSVNKTAARTRVPDRRRMHRSVH
jgi:hypothetical protein